MPNKDLPERFAKIVVRELAQVRAEVEVLFVYVMRATDGASAEKKKKLNSITSRRAKKLYSRLLKELNLGGGGDGNGER